LKFAIVKPGYLADFVDVVVFGGHPENGDGRDSFFGKFLGSLDSAEGFVESKSGTAEQTDLLAADYRSRTSGETIEILEGFLSAAEENVLGAENVGDLVAAVGWEFQRFGIARDGSEVGSVFEEGGEFSEIFYVIAKELRRVRQLMREEGATVHGRLDERTRKR
jgi:hypothetical protein